MFNSLKWLILGLVWGMVLSLHPLMGQTQKIDHQNFTWFVYDMRAKLGDGWAARVELDGRTYLPSFRAQQALAPRLHLVKSFGQRHSAGVGGACFLQFMPQQDQTPVSLIKTELRLHQDLMPEWELGKTRMSHRIRLEERFFLPDPTGNRVLFRFRGRYSLQESFFLVPSHALAFRLGAEVLLQVGDGINGNYFDQFRGFGALVWKANPHWTLDIGYINWWLPQGTGNPVSSRGYVRAAAIHQISFVKKSG